MARKPDTGTLPLSIFEPQSDWKPPHEFPNLRDERAIGLDIETRDPRLTDLGPGFIRKDAEVVGITLATSDRGWYFPIAHNGGGNLARDPVIRYVRDMLSDRNRWIVGANLQYELEGLNSLEIPICGKLVDVQVAEPLIDEESKQGYALEKLCLKYLGRGKDERLLREAADAYGVDPKSGLWKLHSRFVGPYAEFDGVSVMQIFPKQLEKLKEEDLLPIFELESKVLRIFWEMRRQGIPVDVEGAKKFRDELEVQEAKIRVDFLKTYGCKIDEWSGDMLASLCKSHDIPHPWTPKGNPSFTGDWLEEHDHAMLKQISELRTINRLKGTFIEDWILRHVINGRVHPQWRPLASDEGGTRTGRAAAANPNPQQVPARSELAPRLRSLFRNDKWAKLDYSQQEPRLLIHYAHVCKLRGVDAIRDAYLRDRGMDIYQFLAESTGMTRRDSKDATLGRCYGMGADKFAMKQGIMLEVAKQKLKEFDQKVPFVRELSDMCMNMAQQRGYIKTLLGRRRHFNLWEPPNRGKYEPALPLNLAKRAWPGQHLKRAFAYKALNALIQGSAADMTKAAMLLIYEQTGKVPFMAVHDELNYGVADEAEARDLQHMCETCVDITVPIKADLSYGDHWK